MVEHEIDGACGAQGLAASDLDPRVLAEDGKQPIAQELVDPAAVLGYRRADDGEELVQHVDDIVGQPLLRKPREIAQVDEHDNERLLDAGRIRFLQLGRFRSRRSRLQKPRDDEVGGGTDLTGEPHVWRRIDRAERHALGERRGRQRAAALVDAHPASRAARAAAAHGGVRHPRHAAHLEQRRPRRDLNRRTAGVSDRHLRPELARQIAEQQIEGDDGKDAAELDARQRPEPRERVGCGGPRPLRDVLQAFVDARHLDRRGDAAARHDKARERGDGDQDGERNEDRQRAPVGGIEAQPEVDAEAAVHPHEDEQHALHDGAHRPQLGELVDVDVVDAEEHVRDARVDNVRKEPERDQKTERDLHELPQWQPQRDAAGELVERQRDVDDERTQEHDGAGCRAGDGPAPLLHRLHPVEAHEAQRVVEEVGRRERKQDEAGDQPQSLEHVSAPEDVHSCRTRSMLRDAEYTFTANA